MNKKRFIIKCISTVVLIAVILQAFGCGTLIYPERRGQTKGDLDPAVVILDGIGILFFIVPVVVAFARDYTTGAIYLPEDASDDKDVSFSRVCNTPLTSFCHPGIFNPYIIIAKY